MKMLGEKYPRLPIYLSNAVFRTYLREFSNCVDGGTFPRIGHVSWTHLKNLALADADKGGWMFKTDEQGRYQLLGPENFIWTGCDVSKREAFAREVRNYEPYGLSDLTLLFEYILARENVTRVSFCDARTEQFYFECNIEQSASNLHNEDCNDPKYGPSPDISSMSKSNGNMVKGLNPSYIQTVVSDWTSVNETKATNGTISDYGNTSNTYMRSPLEGCSITFKPESVNIKIKEDNTNMAVSTNPSKAFDFDFGVVTGDFIRLSPYGLAVRASDGKYVAWDAKTHSSMNVDVLNFKSDGLIFKMPVAIKAVRVGDVVMHNGYPCYVVEVHESTLKVVDISECAEKEICPVKSPFGFNFITKVMTPVNFNSASADNPFGNLGMMMMFANSGNIDPMMMMLMSGQMGMACGNDPMMTYAMLSMLDNKSGNSSIDLKTMMMAKFFMGNSFDNVPLTTGDLVNA